jgi:hypothetical protein
MMQANTLQRRAALLCLSLVFAHVVQDVNAINLARSNLRGVRDSTVLGNAEGSVYMPEGVDVEVMNKSLPKTKAGTECLCPVGQFWHWRLASCIEQGAWGYECGFFPLEHHHRVCIDNLKCEPLATAQNTTARYMPHGDSLKAKSIPASCGRCQPEDHCLTGKKRQDEECLKQYTIDGKKACVTLKVSTIASAVASATKSYTAKVSEMRKATATASADAQQSAQATGKATAGADATATATATESAKETASASATAKAAATATGQATESATAKASATASATESEKATANAKAKKDSSVTGSSGGIEVEVKDSATGKGTATKVGCIIYLTCAGLSFDRLCLEKTPYF